MIALPPTDESLAFLRLVAALARKYGVPMNDADDASL